MNKIKDLLKKHSYYKLDERKDLLILQENIYGYLIIKQVVEISQKLNDLEISHYVCENNNIQLNINTTN